MMSRENSLKIERTEQKQSIIANMIQAPWKKHNYKKQNKKLSLYRINKPRNAQIQRAPT